MTEPGAAAPVGAESITELRVHGVSGTPPEEVLDRPLLVRVAGDRDAGFYRPRPEYGGAAGPGGARLEAYSWGNLTAGAAARALWLLLLPFTLANVAAWMRPAAVHAGSPKRVRRADAVIQGCCRMLALSLTGTLVVAAVGVALDLVGWQCAAPGTSCGRSRSYLRVLTEGFFSPPGRRLAVTALVPIAVIALLWYLARRTWIHYERYRPDVTGTGEALADPGFWYGRHLVGRLRAIHVSAALATLAAALTFPVFEYDRAPGGESWYSAAGLVVFGAALGIVVLDTVLLWVPSVARRDDPAPGMRRLLKVVRAASIVVVLVAIAYAALSRPAWSSTGSLPGYAGLVAGLFTGQALILIAMTLLIVPLRRAVPKDAEPRPAFAGFATPVLGALALLTASAFSAGVSYRVADWLNGRRVPSPSDIFRGNQLALQPPRAYEWASFGFTFGVVGIVLVVLAVRFWVLPRLVREAAAVTDEDFPGGRGESEQRAAAVDRAIGEAVLTDRVARIMTFVLVPALIAALGIDVVVVLLDIGPVDLAPSGSRAAILLSVLTNAGTWLIGASVFGLLILGVQAYRTPRLRRLVGIVWDLGTFWPRAAHPLAPPCYAERVVPELVKRAIWLAGPGAGRDGVILSGHSQGSVLVAAAYLQLPADVRERTALLTYGSPLCRLYTRFFPGYFGRGALSALATNHLPTAGRWLNLWRSTDPIGGPVGVEGVDRRFVDPLGFGNHEGDTVPPKVYGHSGYYADPAFEVAVAELCVSLRSPPVTIEEPAPVEEPDEPAPEAPDEPAPEPDAAPEKGTPPETGDAPAGEAVEPERSST
jgi:hypothetical protein